MVNSKLRRTNQDLVEYFWYLPGRYQREGAVRVVDVSIEPIGASKFNDFPDHRGRRKN
jgi:hypothetical protein